MNQQNDDDDYYYEEINGITHKLPKCNVYLNDLKHKNLRNIDPKKSKWHSEEVKHKYYNDNLDTLQYRITECISNNYEYLDLSRLNLFDFPDLTSLQNYNDIKNIKYLFINDNNLSDDKFLKQFDNLEVLEISNNKLKYITYVPPNMNELICYDNDISTFQCDNSNITILDCSNNKIDRLPQLQNIIHLNCDNNNITKIQSFSNATQIICSNNPITIIESMHSLVELDCSKTNMTGKLQNMDNLKYLICNDTKINDISNIIHLTTLEFHNSDIKTIPYISTLSDLFFTTDQNVMISKKYVTKEINQEHYNIYIKFKLHSA